jgi:hypothetical protein
MTELGTKFEPYTVKANAGPPAALELGFSELTAGTGLFPVKVKFTALEVPPPGAGLVTVTATTPGKVAAAGMVAVSCLELTTVAVSVTPPKLTIEPATKFVPLIVSVKFAALPAATVDGEIVVIEGTGFCGGGGGVFADTPPPHPARNTALTIPKITSPLTNPLLAFIRHLLLGFSCNPKCQTIPTHRDDVVLALALLAAPNSPHDPVDIIGV